MSQSRMPTGWYHTLEAILVRTRKNHPEIYAQICKVLQCRTDVNICTDLAPFLNNWFKSVPDFVVSTWAQALKKDWRASEFLVHRTLLVNRTIDFIIKWAPHF